MFTQDRTRLREAFAVAWRKHLDGTPVTPLEAQIAAVIAMHPENHALFDDAGATRREFSADSGEGNPYLHMGLHLSLREQCAMDRPPGVRDVVARLERRLGTRHEAEHRAMECLAQALWQAQARGGAADERAYLEALRACAEG